MASGQRPAGTAVAGLLLCAVLGAARAADKPKYAAPAVETVAGAVKSVDEKCASLVVSSRGAENQPDKTLRKEPDAVVWSRSGEGCSFTSIGGKTLVLKAGANVVIRYAAAGSGNVIRWVIVRPESPRLRCIGQGGVAPAPDTLYAIDCDGIAPPECLYCPNPPYSSKAEKQKIAGDLMFRVIILPDGSVTDVQMMTGLEKSLEKNSIQTLRTWQFKPIVGPEGKAVFASSPVSVSFRLAPGRP